MNDYMDELEYAAEMSKQHDQMERTKKQREKYPEDRHCPKCKELMAWDDGKYCDKCVTKDMQP